MNAGGLSLTKRAGALRDWLKDKDVWQSYLDIQSGAQMSPQTIVKAAAELEAAEMLIRGPGGRGLLLRLEFRNGSDLEVKRK